MNGYGLMQERTPVAPRGRHETRGAVLGGLLAMIQACRDESYALWDHSLAVGATSHRLAAALGLPPGARRLVYVGGLLHDVGKTLSRFETLFKPGPLDAEEREHMRLHPVTGARLVRGLELEPVADAVLRHHELFDGSGYPGGLSGARIPLIARIVTVADHYEAMRESRPYRPIPSTRGEALALVARLGAAEKLDPRVAGLLHRVVTPAAPRPARYLQLLTRAL